MPPTRVLFVCLGNICRSPVAEGVFLSQASDRGVLDRFDIDSCGTGGWHAGERPDPRSIAVAERHGVRLPGRARRFDPRADGASDWLIPMDANNRDDLLAAGAPPARVHLLRSFDPSLADHAHDPPDIPDPYYGGPEGFETMFTMISRACAGLLDELLGPEKLTR